MGRKIDYLSPTVLLSDLLAVLFIFLMLSKGGWKSLIQKHSRFIIGSITISVLSLFQQKVSPTSIYFSIKVLELSALAISISLFKPSRWQVMMPLAVSSSISILLALMHFFNQQSVGGLWYFLGERTFSVSTPGISQIISNSGQLLLRPYGTFPHPNVLAGFLVMLLPMLLSSETENNYHYVIKQIALFLFITGIIISFSRIAWIGALFVIIGHLLINHRKKIVIAAFLGLFSLLCIEEIFLGRILNVFSVDFVSISERTLLSAAAIKFFLSSPLFGIGLGQFIPHVPMVTHSPYVLQPVHSIYLLLLSETGIFGLSLFAVLIVSLFSKLWKTRSWSVCLSFLSLLFFGVFDHYSLTLQQTQLLLMLLLGLSL